MGTDLPLRNRCRFLLKKYRAFLSSVGYSLLSPDRARVARCRFAPRDLGPCRTSAAATRHSPSGTPGGDLFDGRQSGCLASDPDSPFVPSLGGVGLALLNPPEARRIDVRGVYRSGSGRVERQEPEASGFVRSASCLDPGLACDLDVTGLRDTRRPSASL